MDNISLFDDLDLDALVEKKEPAKETKAKIQKAARAVAQEVVPQILDEVEVDLDDDLDDEEAVDDLDKLFAAEEAQKPQEDLGLFRSTTMFQLSEKKKVELNGFLVTLEKKDEGYIVSSKEGAKPVVVVSPDPLPLTEACEKAYAYILEIREKAPAPKAEGKKKKESPKPVAPKAPEEPPYSGPRTIRVWGRDLWVETDPKVTEKQIIEKIASDYGLPEFKEGKVLTALDKEHGILNVTLSFGKKG